MIIQTFAVLVQTVIAGFMLYSLTLSYQALKVADRQFRSSVVPDIRILPKSKDSPRELNQTTRPGIFDCVIKNAGADDLEDIYINADFFAIVYGETNALQLIKIPPVITFPSKPTVAFLANNSTTNYTINLENIIPELKEVTHSVSTKGYAARVYIEYQRVSDGRQFSKAKTFFISGDFTMLIEMKSHGLPYPWPNILPVDEIKARLGGE
jgi:hypothetical protein